MSKDKEKDKSNEPELPFLWQKVQSAIWLIGLAILFWQDWIFPGILVLVAISGLTQAAIVWYISREDKQQELRQVRVAGLPGNCPNCGGAIAVDSVRWTGDLTANCPYCNSGLKVDFVILPKDTASHTNP